VKGDADPLKKITEEALPENSDNSKEETQNK